MLGSLGYLKRLLIAVVVPVLLSNLLVAESGDVSLRGQVTDPSGASVPAITVTLIESGKTALEIAWPDLRDGEHLSPQYAKSLRPGSASLSLTIPRREHGNESPFEQSLIR